MSISVRQANFADAPEIARVHVASRIAAYTNIIPGSVLDKQSVKKEETGWRKALERDPEAVLVAIAGQGSVVGFIAFGPSRTRDNEGEIYAVYNRPDYFRSGAGRLLWDAAKQKLVQRGFSTIMALVITENSPSRKFYEGVGFRLVPDSAATFTWEGEVLNEVRYDYIVTDGS